MRVRVSVRGRFHAFDLARELDRLGHLERLVTSYPRALAARFGLEPGRLLPLTRHELTARAVRRLPRGLAQRLEPRVSRAFARDAARRTPDALDLLVAFSGQALEQLGPARLAGAKCVLERGSAHIETQRELLEQAGESAGLRVRLPHSETIARELAEYEAAERIAVPSPFAAHSFLARGFPASKLLVNPYGVDLAGFQPAPRHPAGFRILSVGRVSAQKGSHLLVEAFQRAGVDGELCFVGPIEPELAGLARRAADRRVRFLGPRPQSELPAAYRAANAFALPSWHDGFGLVLLQAMACGLPVLASAHTGAAGVFAERDGVLLAPAGDTDALAAGIRRLYELGEERAAWGRHAALRVASGFSWQDYGRRAVAAYERLLGGEAEPERGALWPSRENPLTITGAA